MKNAIAQRLSETFGEGYAIYTESVEQNMQEPCFFILFLEGIEKQIIRDRYKKIYALDIHFFPAPGLHENEDIDMIAEVLCDALLWIGILPGKLVKGRNTHYQNIDGVLHFFIEYTIFVLKETQENDVMEQLDIKESLKRY